MAGQQYFRYRVTLVTKSPLRIGASQDPLIDVDAPVSVVNGRPVIQGSSLKGAYRSELESLLINEYATKLEAARPCIPADKGNLSDDEKGLITNRNKKYRGPNCGYRSFVRPPKGQREAAEIPICPTCYLLGTMGLIGFVRVPYLFAEGGEIEEGYSIRQDRAIGGAAMRSNRRFQLVPPETRFTGTLEILHEDPIRGWKLGQPRPLQSNAYKDTWLINRPWASEDVVNKLILGPMKNLSKIGGFLSKGFGDIALELQLIE